MNEKKTGLAPTGRQKTSRFLQLGRWDGNKQETTINSGSYPEIASVAKMICLPLKLTSDYTNSPELVQVPKWY